MISGKEIFNELMATTNRRRAKTEISKATEGNMIKVLELIYTECPEGDCRKNFEEAIGILRGELQAVQKAGREEIKIDVSKAEPIPYEIRMIVSHVIYRAMVLADNKYGDIEKADKEVNQSEILRRLGLGHSSLTNWGMRPKQYYYVTHYEQPNSPIHYMGAKTGEYGYAIRNLVYQAGKHKAFADIFGGGGNATLAVPPVDTVQCYYNEADPIVFNTVEVLKDKSLCKELLTLHREFCDEVQRKKDSKFLAGYLPANAAHNAIENAYKDNGYDPYIGYIKDVESLEVDVTDDEKKKFIREFNNELYMGIHCGYGYEIRGKIYKASELKCVLPNGAPDIRRYGSAPVQELARAFKVSGVGTYLQNGERKNVEEIYTGFAYMHYKLVAYWYLFRKMVDKKTNLLFPKNEDKVFYAFAYIFLRYFAYHSVDDTNNTVLLNLLMEKKFGEDRYDYTNLNKIETFLGFPTAHEMRRSDRVKDEPKRVFVTDQIKAFHKRFRNVELSNGDFRVFIDGIIGGIRGDIDKKYARKDRVVFYSDSPYLKTVGYGSKFTSGDMYDLIQKLVHCGQKFIFSCRACKSAAESKEEGEGKPTINSANRSLYNDLFRVFETEAQKAGISLNVLAVEKGGKSLPELIKGSKVAEIMICNFDIHDFSNTGKSAKTKFTAYAYHDFLNIFKNNAIL